jgi:hypothetical protein
MFSPPRRSTARTGARSRAQRLADVLFPSALQAELSNLLPMIARYVEMLI